MALGYRGRREEAPLTLAGVCLKRSPASVRASIDGMLNTVSLPISQIGFTSDGTLCPRTHKPRGTFTIPKWLAKKEGIV